MENLKLKMLNNQEVALIIIFERTYLRPVIDLSPMILSITPLFVACERFFLSIRSSLKIVGELAVVAHGLTCSLKALGE